MAPNGQFLKAPSQKTLSGKIIVWQLVVSEAFSRFRPRRTCYKKLAYDFERLSADPEDAFAAFDFFVTAHHLPEWMFPSSERKRRLIGANIHFFDSFENLATLRSIMNLRGAELMSHVRSNYGLSPIGVGRYSAGMLLVHLTDKGSDLLGPSVIDVRGLAKMVLDHYTSELGPVEPRPKRRFDRS